MRTAHTIHTCKCEWQNILQMMQAGSFIGAHRIYAYAVPANIVVNNQRFIFGEDGTITFFIVTVVAVAVVIVTNNTSHLISVYKILLGFPSALKQIKWSDGFVVRRTNRRREEQKKMERK